MTLADTFDRIYRGNKWNGVESRSGPGSGTAATHHLVSVLPKLCEMLNVRSVLNVGCGDDFWMPELPDAIYYGVDVSRIALARARKTHPERSYAPAYSKWPEVDLVICRDVIQHLSFETAVPLLDRISRHGRWLLLSTYMRVENGDTFDGGYTEPNLMRLPYNLGPPMLMIFDGWDYETGEDYRDTRKFLGLWAN